MSAAISCALPIELSDRLRERVAALPGLTLSGEAEVALVEWLRVVEAPRLALASVGGEIIKPAGEPFPAPPRGASGRIGRPQVGEARTEGEGSRAHLRVYLPDELAARVRAAAWWRRRYVAWDLTEALARYLDTV